MGYEIDFLAVGEGEKSGDAIAVRLGNLYGERSEQIVIVIDGGYKDSGENLVEHIKQYYNTDIVDIVISTHPDSDHSSGLSVVLENLTVCQLWMHRPWEHTTDIAKLFKDGRVTDKSIKEKLRDSLNSVRILEEIANEKGIPISEPFRGLNSKYIDVIGPTQEYYESLLPDFRATPEAKETSTSQRNFWQEAKEVIKKIMENWSFETLDDEGETSAENNSSVILLISIENDHLMLTGDAGIPALTEAIEYLEYQGFNTDNLKLIQVPHHGSKNNVGPEILDRIIGPKISLEQEKLLAYISASKKGAPKHPSKKVINAFKRRGASVHTTQGSGKRYSHNAPRREGWVQSIPEPFHSLVEDYK